MCKGTEVDKEVATEREMEAVRQMAEVLADKCPFRHEEDSKAKLNGRCEYHEDITTGLAEVKGGVRAMKWAIGLGVPALVTLQITTLFFVIRHIAGSPAAKKVAAMVIGFISGG